MSVLKKLKELLDEARISYEVYNHPLACTAQEIAAPAIINHGQTTDLIFEQYVRGFFQCGR